MGEGTSASRGSRSSRAGGAPGATIAGMPGKPAAIIGAGMAMAGARIGWPLSLVPGLAELDVHALLGIRKLDFDELVLPHQQKDPLDLFQVHRRPPQHPAGRQRPAELSAGQPATEATGGSARADPAGGEADPPPHRP